MSLNSIYIKTGLHRSLLLFAAVFSVIAVGFFAKWCFAHAVSLRAGQVEIADFSVALAPNDPQTHFASGVLNEKNFLPESLEKAVAEYKKAVALSPDDYLLWIAFGRASEKNGDAEGAEKAFHRALELAPNYADTHWAYGNNLLRRGKTEEAFSEIRQAAASSNVFIIPAISIAWQVFDGDSSQVIQNIGKEPLLKAPLANFLANRQKYTEAFDVWKGSSPEMKSDADRVEIEALYNQFIAAGKYLYARQIRSSLDKKDDTNVFGKINNGGFENNVKQQQADFFDWRIADGVQPLVGYDDNIKHGGSLSLVMIFNSPDGKDFRSISQIVAVREGQSYQLESFYKADLKALGTMRWEVINASDRTLIAATKPIESVADWSNIGVEFTAPQNSEAVIINLARISCGSTICPISGKVWFDDFNISEK